MRGDTYLARGSADDIEAAIEWLREKGFETARNPDLYVRSYGTLSIGDVRSLIERTAFRGVAGRRIFLLAADMIPVESQNALLKTLEEPPADALILLLYRAPDTLLPTVRSRMQPLTLASRARAAPLAVDIFVASPIAKRLDMLKPLLEKSDDEKRDIGAIISFLDALERTLGADQADALRAVYRARKYSGDRGALLKPLLEQVAFFV